MKKCWKTRFISHAIGVWLSNMKKKIVIPALLTLVSGAVVSTIVASLAWFSTKVTVTTKDNLTGSSNGSYYAYGDGSATDNPDTMIKEGPYGIETPRQLYNLAWLQYLGYYDSGKYFELANDIDMEGWILPPIGTTIHPFVSEFNGNGYTINNLTISNDIQEILDTNKAPSRIKRLRTITDVNVVGMFGVVGKLDGVSTSSEVTNIKDFTLSGASIHNIASNTLMGIAAGYVNGPISDVTITDGASGGSNLQTTNASNFSSFDSRFTNISKYGVVGFCENEYLDKVKNTVTETYNATSSTYDYIASQEGDGQSGWGGSIDMKTTYNGIFDVWSKFDSTPDNIYKYPSTRKIVYGVDGNVESDEYGEATTEYRPNNSTYYRLFHYDSYNSRNEKTASYTLAHRSDTDRYMYLYGKNDITIDNAITATVTRKNSVSKTVTIISFDENGTTYYLTEKDGEVASTTVLSEAGKWVFENSQLALYTDDAILYLCADDDQNLYLSETESDSDWYRDSTSKTFYITVSSGWWSSTDYTLYCRNGQWGIEEERTGEETLYSIGDGNGHYLSTNGTAIASSTSKEAAMIWRYDNTYGFYTIIDGTNYYLRQYYRNNRTPSISLRTQTGGNYYYPFLISGNNVRAAAGNTGNYYYLRYSNNQWNSVLSNAVTLDIESKVISYSYVTEISQSTESLISRTTTTSTENYVLTTQPTYFPLNQEIVNDTPNGVPKNTNTGYVTCDNTGSSNWQGNIRVSQYYNVNNTYSRNGRTYTYPQSLLGTTYADNKVTLDTVYTIDDSGETVDLVPSEYEKFASSKASFEKVLTEDTMWIYGLHFMNANIEYGAGKSIYADGVVINDNVDTDGVPYNHYELPTNCIDFNLRETGKINFIAGSYFTDNDSFFSLHQIERNSDKSIKKIRQIKNVYKNSENESYSYVYEFYDTDTANGYYKYSKPFKFSNGVKVNLDNTSYVEYSSQATLPDNYSLTGGFNCSRIDTPHTLKTQTTTQNNNNYLQGYPYYFEIPMNDGEYCLGSVNGGTGAYLMYLDIGANAKKVYRTEVIEYFKMIDQIYSYPRGVGLVAAGSQASDMNSFCVCIKSSYNGTLTMQIVKNGDVDEGKYTGAGGEEITYKYPSMVVKNGSGVAQEVVSSEVTTSITEIKRLTYYDFDMLSNSLNKIIITDTFVNGVKKSRTVEKFANYNISTNTGTADDTLPVFAIGGDGKAIDYTDNTDGITFDTTDNTTKLLVFNVIYPDGGVITVTFTLTVTSIDNAGHNEYLPNGYDVNVTYSKGDATTDISANCYITYVVNSDGTYTYTIKLNGNTASVSTVPIVINVG